MKKILDQIVAEKKNELAQQKFNVGIEKLEQEIFFNRPCLSLKNEILIKKKPAIIAEFKRQSPSKGMFKNKIEVQDVVKSYANFGAAGVSILTNTFFGGNNQDILSVRDIEVPILRKEFIVDEYQIFESKAIGADCILLIAACLNKTEIKKFASLAKQLKLEVLLEIHEEKDLDFIQSDIDMVGINNRNLQTFEVDLDHSIKLLKKIPPQFVCIAESGIKNATDLKQLSEIGFQGFLIGEMFMQQSNPALALQTLIENF